MGSFIKGKDLDPRKTRGRFDDSGYCAVSFSCVFLNRSHQIVAYIECCPHADEHIAKADICQYQRICKIVIECDPFRTDYQDGIVYRGSDYAILGSLPLIG